MSGKSKSDVHPIVVEALDLARVGVEPVEFPGWIIEDLKRSLAKSFGQPDLMKAVVDLINLADILKKGGSPTAAMNLIEIVCTAANALEDLNKKRI